MSLSIDRFDEFFRALYEDKHGKPLDPFPWQTRLAEQVDAHGWPECIDLPTASGKTACIDIAVFVLACQAAVETNKRTIGRRVFFTVNRRVIVDEAFDRAFKIAERLRDAKDGILKEVADALRDISGNKDAPPLDVAQLRGGIYRDRAWARSITQPIVVCTTADQLGSRLLFRGYGVSPSMQPVHAALAACDSLVLLDEAHVTRAFCQTMRLLTKYQQVRTEAAGADAIPPMRFVQMTATPVDVKERFELDDEDRSHPVLEARQNAPKPAMLVKLDRKKPIVDEIVSRAFAALSDTRKAVGIIVNRVQTARGIEQAIRTEIEKRAKKDDNFVAEAHLVIGRMRPIDRDDLQKQLRAFVGPDRPDILDKPIFVVATQCLEVGADYDFDALITECASIDALRQRFGRLNRKGRSIEAIAAIVTNDESIKGDDPIYGDAIKHTWEWLSSNKNENDQINFGIAAFRPLWERVQAEQATYLDEGCSKPLLSPTQNAAVLLPAHLDALCQTNPQPVPSPDVNYFIHGPHRDMAEVNVCWRADLGDNEAYWPEIVRLLPPTSPECMTVPLWEVRRWMQGASAKDNDNRDADVPVAGDADKSKPDQITERSVRRVVVWRGSKDCRIIESLNDLLPGDTVVIRAKDLLADIECEPTNRPRPLGHIPNLPVRESLTRGDAENGEEYKLRRLKVLASFDLGERAVRESRRRLIVRLHAAFPEYAGLRGLGAVPLRKALEVVLRARFEPGDEAKRQELSRILRVLSSSFEPHPYPGTDDDSADDPNAKPSRMIVFKHLLDPPKRLVVPSDDEDDGEDKLSELLLDEGGSERREADAGHKDKDRRPPSLEEHTQHVIDRIKAALDRLSLNGLAPTVHESARIHDLGKADARFQAMLAGVTPYEAMMRPALLGKGDGQRRTVAEKRMIRTRAMLPEDFRHEMLSVEIVQGRQSDLVKDAKINLYLLLHLIAAHHGHARPFAPVCIDEPTETERKDDNRAAFADRRSVVIGKSDHWPAIEITAEERDGWIPSHRLDSGVAERFWTLTRKHGWWGLAWLESILRLADQQASAGEQEGENR